MNMIISYIYLIKGQKSSFRLFPWYLLYMAEENQHGCLQQKTVGIGLQMKQENLFWYHRILLEIFGSSQGMA